MINAIKNVMVSSLIIASSLYAITAQAETPDGLTPAEETICDPLKADGVTKGLYGLCVAFCEAQDYAEVSDPITEEELEALYDATPSGRLLTNYTKRAIATDPPMPCIVVEQPCPCFTADELLSIDGYAEDGASLINDNAITLATRSYHRESGEDTSGLYEDRFASVIYRRDNFCTYWDRSEEGTDTYRSLSVRRGTVTEAELVGCKAMLDQSIIDHGH